MNWRVMFKGDYLAAVEFGNRLFTAKIADVRLCKLEGEDGRSKDKGVVFFEGHDRGWVLCKTNAMCVAGMFGEDVESWKGHNVTLYATMVSVGKSKQPGIRVKGSPDLKEPVQVEIKLPRKKPFTMTLQPTGKQSGAAKPPPPPEPAADPEPPADSEPETTEERIEF